MVFSVHLNVQLKFYNLPQSNTPTLFFHGGGNRYHAEAQMGQVAENAGVTTSVIRAMGLKKGRFKNS
ncbi:hypothetical protein AZJ01_03440 [Lactiplantibacillus plantarum]|nr:hypothetical protein AZJ01_03440 [Lactiplantibacillus plantarum]